MEPRRRDHEFPHAGVHHAVPQEAHAKLKRRAGLLEALTAATMKEEEEEEGGSEPMLHSVSSSESESDSDGDYEPDDHASLSPIHGYNGDEVRIEPTQMQSIVLAEELLASGEKSSMRKGGYREKLSGKKRTADVLQKGSPIKAGEEQEDIVEEGQASGRKKHHLIVRCEPKIICEVVRLLNGPQREKVKELGFGCLFDFNMDGLASANFIAWLMDHLDPDTMVLDFGGSRKLHVTEHAVWCVLGLHRGNMDPPLSIDRISLQPLREKLGIPEKTHIDVAYLIQKVQSGGTDRFTMQCFMMIVFAKLLACNTNFFISSSVWSLVQDIDNFGNMDWCKFVVNHLWYSASMWKKQDGNRTAVYGCCAFLVIFYLDNLNCTLKMRCVDTPRAKFFKKRIMSKLKKADELTDQDGLRTFGNLSLRTQRGTCYEESSESSRHAPTSMPAPITGDIARALPRPRKRLSRLSSCKIPAGKENRRQQQNRKLDSQQIQEQHVKERKQKDERALAGNKDQQTLVCNSSEFVLQQNNGFSGSAVQWQAPALEAPAVVDQEPTVPYIPEEPATGEPEKEQASVERDQGDHAVTGRSEDGDGPAQDHRFPAAAEAVQLASAFVDEQMKEFMAGTSEPEILESCLSKIVSLLAQVRAEAGSKTRNSELEQQVKELTEKLCNTEEELEATRATLGRSKAATLEAQSAVAAISSLALRVSATFVRLGDTRSRPPPSVASSSLSLEEAVKLLEDRVSLIEPVSRGHAVSLARSSLAFGAAAMLCRERGVEGLRDAVAADTRRFVRSQGPEFQSLVGQVVDAVVQQHATI
ncbi:hypothetical protein ACP70R_035255 [Stipagrostis hirtigluma subsp. patula]